MAYVGDRLDLFAQDHPERAALRCGPACLSWRDLVQALASLEFHLRRRTRPGDQVVLQLGDPVSLLLAFFACARSGRIAVVMDPEWPVDLRTTVLQELAPGLVVDRECFDCFSEAHDTSGEPARGLGEAPRETDLFYAGFTSGSSGTPKGYVRSHGSWLTSFALSSSEFGISRSSTIVIPGRLSHSLHLYGAVCGLACGQEVVLFQRFDPRAVLTALTDASAGAVLYATPTQLSLLDEAARRSEPLPNVKHVLSSGAKWHAENRRALRTVFPHALLFEFFGASETSFIALSGPGDNAPDGSVGCAVDGVEIAIGDPRQPATPGEIGSIWVRSDLLFAGYLCGASQITRWQEGWLTVGDQGYLDENGFLFLTGRENRMVVTSGLNVYPEEVEAVLCSHENVAAAVVVGRPDPLRGERLEAILQLRSPDSDASAVLSRLCRTTLAAGKEPRAFHFWDNLPLTAGGKPDLQRIMTILEAEGGWP